MRGNRDSYTMDLVCAIAHGKVKTFKHILLAFAVKSLTGHVQLIRILNRFGHCVSYNVLEESDTSLCMYKSEQDGVILPDQGKSYVPATLAWDNTNRLDEVVEHPTGSMA